MANVADADGTSAAIVTVTLNPAVDVHTGVAEVVPDRKLRCRAPTYDPGGGGINVARAVHRLGGDALACFPCGGAAGELLRGLLTAEGVRQLAIPIAGTTRENLNAREDATGRQFRFCLPGPTLDPTEWHTVLARVAALRPAPAFLVASGSLPPDVPVNAYAELARVAAALGSRFVLDTSGEPLRRALGSGIHLLKPSRRELLDMVGRPACDDAELPDVATGVVARGWCDVLVLSLGADGALVVGPELRQRLTTPPVAVASGVGAGDSMVAGIVLALVEGRTLAEATRRGVAAGAAAVMNPGTELCHRDDVERLAAAVTVTTV